MKYCQVSHDLNRYENEQADLESRYEWVEAGPVDVVICPVCALFFSRYTRAPAYNCGRCADRNGYPWVKGKRAKWPGGPVLDIGNIDMPEPDPDFGRDE